MQDIPDHVAKRLRYYVYRLIDPRNGETFYVGKGSGKRVYQHVRATSAEAIDGSDEDAFDLKLQRIKDIKAAQLEVGHVIHRHGITDEKVALEIEAAVMDSYPGLANRAGGHGSGDYGCRNISQIIAEYTKQEFEVVEPFILISIARSYHDDSKSIYDAVRGCWRIRQDRAEGYELVIAHRRGEVVGAFRPLTWLLATKANFPWLPEDIEGRIGFEGKEAELETKRRYLGKRVPDRLRAKGAANPVRFVNP